MEERNVIFEVTKIGFAVNSKWSVFVDNEFVGKIDFKQNLTKKLSKGKHSVQYKVGVQKTKVLDFVVADEDIIVECVFDGTVSNFHVVGGNTTVENNIPNNITKEIMFCNKCGTEIAKNSNFCNSCGNKIKQVNSNTTKEINTQQNATIKEQNTLKNETNNEKPNIAGILGGIIGIIIIIVTFWNIYGGNGVDGEYWFSDGSGYVKIDKDINTIRIYDEYNNYLGSENIRFTGDKTFVYSDGLLEYTGTINGKKLTVKCENDKIEGFEATKK